MARLKRVVERQTIQRQGTEAYGPRGRYKAGRKTGDTEVR